MIQARGWVKDDEIEEFLAVGYGKQQVLSKSVRINRTM